MRAFERQDRAYPAHLIVVWGAFYSQRINLTKTRNAGQPYGSEEKEKESLKGKGI